MMLKKSPVMKIIGSYSSFVNSPFIPPKRESRIPIITTAVYLMNSTGIVKCEISPNIIPNKIPISAQSMGMWLTSLVYYLIATTSGNPKINIFEIFFINVEFYDGFFEFFELVFERFLYV